MTTIPDDIQKTAVNVANECLSASGLGDEDKYAAVIAHALLAERERNEAEIAALKAENERMSIVLSALNLTTEQLSELASGDLVVVPNPLKARERADAIVDRARAALEGK